jgi:hypothetical protein
MMENAALAVAAARIVKDAMARAAAIDGPHHRDVFSAYFKPVGGEDVAASPSDAMSRLAAPVTPAEWSALDRASYPGRSQIVDGWLHQPSAVPHAAIGALRAAAPLLLLDGAHTVESVRAAAVWCFESALPEAIPAPARDVVLVFASSRDAPALLGEIYATYSSRIAAVFFPELPAASGPSAVSSPARCLAAWQSLIAAAGAPAVEVRELLPIVGSGSVAPLTPGAVYVGGSGVDVVSVLRSSLADGGVQEDHVRGVFVTGSLYLLSDVMAAADPSLADPGVSVAQTV